MHVKNYALSFRAYATSFTCGSSPIRIGTSHRHHLMLVMVGTATEIRTAVMMMVAGSLSLRGSWSRITTALPVMIRRMTMDQ